MGTGTFKDSQNGGALPPRVTAAARPALQRRGTTVAKAELGTKRIDPETGRKFYDLNKDPIVSPYTGKSYPRSYFDSGDTSVEEEEEEVQDKEADGDDEAPEVISLEDADEEGKDDNDNLPDLGDDEDDVEIDDDEDDTFLPDEEEEDDDVNDIIGVGGDDDDEV